MATTKAKSTSKSKTAKTEKPKTSKKKKSEVEVSDEGLTDIKLDLSYVSAEDHSEIHKFDTPEELFEHFEEARDIAYGKNGYKIGAGGMHVFVPMESMRNAEKFGAIVEQMQDGNEDDGLGILDILEKLG